MPDSRPAGRSARGRPDGLPRETTGSNPDALPRDVVPTNAPPLDAVHTEGESSLGAGIHVDLTSTGVAVRDGFVSPERVRELIECAMLRRKRGDFGAARIGADERLQRLEEVRGDSTCWLEEPCVGAEGSLLIDLENLRLALNKQAFLGLFDCELHYAWYPPGAGYARHVDQLRGHAGRRLSFVIYLNESWRTGDGGELRVFDGAYARGYRDIEPIAGRLVCFLTESREHAVLATRIDRLSLTGWFYGRREEP